MIIEAMARWTQVQINPMDKEEAHLRMIMEGEQTPEYTPEFSYGYGPVVFDMRQVERFNRSEDRKCTAIRFSDGDMCVLDIAYTEFRNLYMEVMGVSIHSTITPSQQKAADKPKPTREGGTNLSGADGIEVL
jgi:hypothetical protein